MPTVSVLVFRKGVQKNIGHSLMVTTMGVIFEHLYGTYLVTVIIKTIV